MRAAQKRAALTEHTSMKNMVREMEMYQLLYASNAVNLMSEDELKLLLEQSRQKNRRLGIGGMLVYHEGAFLQILEGEESQINALFETIRSDKRHDNVTFLGARTVEERTFQSWDMAFQKLEKTDLAAFPVLRDLLIHSDRRGPEGLSEIVDTFLFLTTGT
jgi:hypothetical protein